MQGGLHLSRPDVQDNPAPFAIGKARMVSPQPSISGAACNTALPALTFWMGVKVARSTTRLCPAQRRRS